MQGILHSLPGAGKVPLPMTTPHQHSPRGGLGSQHPVLSFTRHQVNKLLLTAKLSPGKRIPPIPTSLQALLRRQGRPIKLILGIGQRPSILGIISPTSQMVIIRNRNLINRQESGILVDRYDISASTDLRGVAGARVVALLLVNLLAVDGVAAVAHAVVL